MSTTPEKYKLTEEHKAQLKGWADKWIENAMSTVLMTADDKIECVKYVKELYTVANLPVPTFIYFVPSPFAMLVIGGFAAAIAQLGNKSKYTIPQMVDMVLNSADVKSNTKTKWYVGAYDVKKLNAELGLGELGLECVKKSRDMWNGGNQWSGWVSHISFFRHVAKLPIDYSKWDCYEQLTKLSGPRIMGETFCIVSDKPVVLTVNDRNQPHNETGPFCKWSDGCALYSINSVRIPAYVVDNPEKITVELIENESNVEIRRVMIDRYGKDKFILDSKSEIVHTDDFGTLYKKDLTGDEPIYMVKVVNSTPEPDGTYKDYWLRVDPKLYGGITTARAAVASTWRNKDGSLLFKKPEDYTLEVET
jgi:hypothetical protein